MWRRRYYHPSECGALRKAYVYNHVHPPVWHVNDRGEADARFRCAYCEFTGTFHRWALCMRACTCGPHSVGLMRPWSIQGGRGVRCRIHTHTRPWPIASQPARHVRPALNGPPPPAPHTHAHVLYLQCDVHPHRMYEHLKHPLKQPHPYIGKDNAPGTAAHEDVERWRAAGGAFEGLEGLAWRRLVGGGEAVRTHTA